MNSCLSKFSPRVLCLCPNLSLLSLKSVQGLRCLFSHLKQFTLFKSLCSPPAPHCDPLFMSPLLCWRRLINFQTLISEAKCAASPLHVSPSSATVFLSSSLGGQGDQGVHQGHGQAAREEEAGRRDGQGEDSASLGLCWGGMRASAFLLSVCLSTSVCLSVCLTLSLLIVCLPGWRCNVAVSAVKVPAAGFSLSEPWLCAVSVCRSRPVHTDSAVQATCRPLSEHQLQGAGRHERNLNFTYNKIMFFLAPLHSHK